VNELTVQAPVTEFAGVAESKDYTTTDVDAQMRDQYSWNHKI
jgi:hypothetical protein